MNYRKSNKKWKSCLPWLLVLFLLIGQSAAQQADPCDSEDLFDMSLEELMDVEIGVASRKAATQKESPGIVSVVTREEIQKSGARDLIDILRLIPGVDVSYDTQGAYGVFVRGIWANEGKTMVLMDGIEMNDDLYGTFQFGHHIPVDIIERIEIMRGPGSVMYGESAELAVISITTISPETDTGGILSSTYSRTRRKYDRMNATGYYGMKKEDFSFSVIAHHGRGNFTDGVSTNYDLDYAHSTVDLSSNKGSLVESPFINASIKKGNFSFRYIHDEYRLNSAWVVDDPDARYQMQFDSDIFQGKYELPISDELSMTSKFTYKHQKPWSWAGRGGGVGRALYSSNKYTGETYFSYDLEGGHNIVVGVSYEKIAREYRSPKWTEAKYYCASIFGEGSFITPYGNLTLGVRQVKHNFSGTNLIPRAALTKQLGDYHIKALYSQAYRNPHPTNIYRNPNIKPEHTTIYEFEVGKQMSENWLVTANVFDVEINDPIIYTRWAPGDIYYNNFEKTATRGVEVSSLYKKGTSSLNLTYSYYIPREQEVTEYAVPGRSKTNLGVANHKFSLVASYSPYKNMFITPSLTYHTSKYGLTNYDDGPADDWVYEKLDPTLMANLALLFKDMFNKKGMDLTFTIHNLFDEKYLYSQPYQESYGLIPGPSRAFTMNFRYKF